MGDPSKCNDNIGQSLVRVACYTTSELTNEESGQVVSCSESEAKTEDLLLGVLMRQLYQKMMLNDKNTPSRNNHYHSYLLRIWYEEGYGWRVSLQPTCTQERLGFADLYSAMMFVEQSLLQGKSK